MNGESDDSVSKGDERLELTRDMMINDRRCVLRVLVSDGMADVTFDATAPAGVVIGSLSGTVAIEDLVHVTRAIAMTLGSVAQALGLTGARSVGLDEIRKNHPRAGMTWSADEDQRLLKRYQDGATLLELSDEFERNIGGIASRLKLHGFRPPLRRDHDDDDPNLDYADIGEPDLDWP
ncbi:hypothetical protein ACQP2F_05550 [Actinoplanes sp. CA-030573]|uniref:hypothetical protein n=1 Tax=Actinoplanes sp. CA-030573 TaxID=3239898 RepID=UPI003D8FB8C0